MSSQVGSVAVEARFTYDHSASAAAVGHVVEFAFSVKNTGLLTLFEVNVFSGYLERRESTIACVTDATSNAEVVGSAAGAVDGMMPYPDSGLIPGRSIECTARVEVTQTEVSFRGYTFDYCVHVESVSVGRSVEKASHKHVGSACSS